MIRRTVTQIAAEDLARMLEADGLRCAARLLRMAYVGSHGALVADAMADVLADVGAARLPCADVAEQDLRRRAYTTALTEIRDDRAIRALGALARLSGDLAPHDYLSQCATEQGVEVML